MKYLKKFTESYESESQDKSFWMVWGDTYEGNRVWFMVRTPDDWTKGMVYDRACEGCRGGVGGDVCDIVEVEEGYTTDIYTDYHN